MLSQYAVGIFEIFWSCCFFVGKLLSSEFHGCNCIRRDWNSRPSSTFSLWRWSPERVTFREIIACTRLRDFMPLRSLHFSFLSFFSHPLSFFFPFVFCSLTFYTSILLEPSQGEKRHRFSIFFFFLLFFTNEQRPRKCWNTTCTFHRATIQV